jgi:hypothetical protein
MGSERNRKAGETVRRAINSSQGDEAMTREALLQRIGEAAIKTEQTRRELERSEGLGQRMQAREDRQAHAIATKALRALIEEAESV